MNKIQRENLAKYSYDVSKLVLAGFVVANIMSGKFSLSLSVFGFIASVLLLILGFLLNKKEN